MTTEKIDEEKFSVFKETVGNVIFGYGPNFAINTIIDAAEELLAEHWKNGYIEGLAKGLDISVGE